MSGLDVNAVGPRGDYYDATRVAQALGLERSFQNMTDATPDATLRDARMVKMQLVVNGEASAALLPNQLVTYKTLLSGEKVVKAAATVGTLIHGVVDSHLPAAGVPAGSAFWMTREGPTKFINDAAAALTEFLPLSVSPSVAGSVRATDLTPSSDADGMDQQVGRVGQAEAAADASATFWGYLKLAQ